MSDAILWAATICGLVIHFAPVEEPPQYVHFKIVSQPVESYRAVQALDEELAK